MSFQDLLDDGILYEEERKQIEPSILDTTTAAVTTSLTGATTFSNMVSRKSMMPNNEGDDDYSLSDEFNEVVNTLYPDISISNLAELKDARNKDYLEAKVHNQLRRKTNLEVLEKSGVTGMAMEGFFSMADAPSWIVGGGIFKVGGAVKTAMNIQKYGASTLYDMGRGGLAVGASVAASEKAIQTESGVIDSERTETMAKYGAMFGVALPLLATTFSTVATGEGRQALASNTGDLVSKIPGGGTLRGWGSLSTADQLIHKSKSPKAAEFGKKATTVVTAEKDANGNFITSSEDTAMDYVDTVVNKALSEIQLGAKENAKVTGKPIEEQSLIDGRDYDNFSNQTEQHVRGEIAKMSDDEVRSIYKEATGQEKLEAEKNREKLQSEVDVVQNKLDISKQRVETVINNSILDKQKIKIRGLEKNRIVKLKSAQAQLEKEKVSIAKANEKDLAFLNRKHMKSAEPQISKKQEAINIRNKRLEELQLRVEELSVETKLTDEQLQAINKKVRSEHQSILNNLDKGAQKQVDSIAKGYKDSFKDPEDLYDVVTAHLRSKGFDEGKYVAPVHLKYMEGVYTQFGKDATDVGLKGIAGKDSRGYNHIKYNEDFILSKPKEEVANMFKDMINADKLNQELLRKGQMTAQEVEDIANRMVDRALDRDFKNKYLDGGRGNQATSATGRRKLRMDRSLYPDMFVQDITVIGTEYSDKIGGKIALKKVYDIDTNNLGQLAPQIEEKAREIAEDALLHGASQREAKRDADNVRAVLETVVGSRKYNKDPNSAVNKVSRIMRKGASALYSAGFVKYAIVENTVAILRNGLAPTIDNYVPAFKSTLEHIKNANSDAPMVKLGRQAGIASQTLRGLKFDRYDNLEVIPTTGKAEMFLDKASHWSRKISGFNFVNDWSDWVAGGSALHELQTIMKRPTDMTTAEASRMARFGLSSEDITNIQKQDIKYSDDGQVTDWNYDNWKDQTLAKNFIRYLGRATRDTVMRADGTRIHRWQSDVNNPIASLALQFTQMPVALYERILLNLGDEASTRTAVGTIMAVGGMYAILALEDAALVASGAKDELDDFDTLLVKAAVRTPMVGIVPSFIDLGLTLTGNETLGSSYVPKTDLASMAGGAGYTVANKAFKAATGFAQDGLTGTTISNGMKLMPILNSLIPVSAGMKGIEKDLKTNSGDHANPIYNTIGGD